MKLRTEISLLPWSQPIGYGHNIVCLGSCFATNIAERLLERKFRVVASPTGILFNPTSIAQAVVEMTEGERVDRRDLIEHDGRYFDYRFHTSFSATTPEETVVSMNEALERGKVALAGADMLILTLGTAWVYRLRESGAVVANCLKQPASLFSRELLSVKEIVEAIEKILSHTTCRVLLTLSPVRHVGEGLEDNSLSKALLRVAISEVVRNHGDRVGYFPAYEIVMDDLRDYRFYGDDLVHPSAMAVDYIAEKFFDVALSAHDKVLMAKVEEVIRARQHRPSNPESEAYRRFCSKQIELIDSLKGVDFSEEREYFSAYVTNKFVTL